MVDIEVESELTGKMTVVKDGGVYITIKGDDGASVLYRLDRLTSNLIYQGEVEQWLK